MPQFSQLEDNLRNLRQLVPRQIDAFELISVESIQAALTQLLKAAVDKEDFTQL